VQSAAVFFKHDIEAAELFWEQLNNPAACFGIYIRD
jgi:hypothetical protein